MTTTPAVAPLSAEELDDIPSYTSKDIAAIFAGKTTEFYAKGDVATLFAQARAAQTAPASCPYCGKDDGKHDEAFPHPRTAQQAPQAIVGAELPPMPDGDEFSATRMLANGDLAPRFTAATMREYARAAIAADRAQRAVVAPSTKTWKERLQDHADCRPGEAERRAMMAEIFDLRAQLARQGQGEPVYQAQLNGDEWYDLSAEKAAKWQADGFRVRTLYASPAQASAAPADPMDEVISMTRRQHQADRNECFRLGEIEGRESASAAPGQARAAVPEPLTIKEAFEAVGGWYNGGELGYPSFGSADALRVYTVKMQRNAVQRALAASPEPATAGTVLPDAAMQASKGATDGAVGGA